MTRFAADSSVAEPSGAALRAVGEVVAAMAVAPSLEATLQGLVRAARTLASCRYAAVGVPDGSGGFSHFITAGMSDELIAAIGRLPRTHGLLSAMLERPQPHRTSDISKDPRYVPAPQPIDVSSELSVPIVLGHEVFGVINIEGGRSFEDEDVSSIQVIADHLAVAIKNAELFDESREAAVMRERARLA